MTGRAGCQTAIVGVGYSDFFARGASHPRTLYELAGDAIIAAAADAGLPIEDIDGFAYYANASAGAGVTFVTAAFMQMLGMREVGFTSAVTMGGGGSAGAIGLASAAIAAGDAIHVVTVMALQQGAHRLGSVFGGAGNSPDMAFLTVPGLVGPGPMMAPIARRHMHRYGTSRDAFAEIAITSRNNALTNPRALQRTRLTREQYFASRMVAEPMCLFDFCLETDGAVALITTSAERARDLRQPPAYVLAWSQGGTRDWGRSFFTHAMPDEIYASSGMRSIAGHLYGRAGIGPGDIDVALLYDHFTPLVVMQLEDFGFCGIGEGGPFVQGGAIRMDGSIPINPHGGNLSEAYVMGATHLAEAVLQLRGTAANQVQDCDIALVTGGPAPVPVSAVLLTR